MVLSPQAQRSWYVVQHFDPLHSRRVAITSLLLFGKLSHPSPHTRTGNWEQFLPRPWWEYRQSSLPITIYPMEVRIMFSLELRPMHAIFGSSMSTARRYQTNLPERVMTIRNIYHLYKKSAAVPFLPFKEKRVQPKDDKSAATAERHCLFGYACREHTSADDCHARTKRMTQTTTDRHSHWIFGGCQCNGGNLASIAPFRHKREGEGLQGNRIPSHRGSIR